MYNLHHDRKATFQGPAFHYIKSKDCWFIYGVKYSNAIGGTDLRMGW